jgi:hypothetical protein
MEKRYDIVDAFIYGMKNMMRTLRELTETKEEIRIIKKGRRITAAYYVDGKCVRHANTKCSKEDNFDFEYGSKLAFKRMWGDPDA